MADSEQVLTQEQLDTMLAGGPREQFVPAETPPETPVNVSATSMEEIRAREAASPPPASAPEQAGTSPAEMSATDSSQATLTQLSERLARLEAAMQEAGQLQQQFRALVDQLHSVNGTMESLRNSLQSTVGFGAHQSFVCSSCQGLCGRSTQLHRLRRGKLVGVVAAPVALIPGRIAPFSSTKRAGAGLEPAPTFFGTFLIIMERII